MEITDKVILITGAKRIGSVVAVYLADRGADVALTFNRSRSEADQTVRAVRAKGRRASALQVDLTKEAEIQALVQHVVQELGGIDILINMASVYRSKPFLETTMSDWQVNIDTNLKSTYLCAKGVIPAMQARGGGRIINFADWLVASGRPRYRGFLEYYTSKAGVVGLTESLALELAFHNILVNAIAPGPILAPPDLTAEEDLEVRKATPLGRWGGEIEIAKAVAFLIETDFVTGECLRVDGGRHLS